MADPAGILPSDPLVPDRKGSINPHRPSWPTATILATDPFCCVPASSLSSGFLPPFILDRAYPLALWYPYHVISGRFPSSPNKV